MGGAGAPKAKTEGEEESEPTNLYFIIRRVRPPRLCHKSGGRMRGREKRRRARLGPFHGVTGGTWPPHARQRRAQPTLDRPEDSSATRRGRGRAGGGCKKQNKCAKKGQRPSCYFLPFAPRHGHTPPSLTPHHPSGYCSANPAWRQSVRRSVWGAKSGVRLQKEKQADW